VSRVGVGTDLLKKAVPEMLASFPREGPSAMGMKRKARNNQDFNQWQLVLHKWFVFHKSLFVLLVPGSDGGTKPSIKFGEGVLR
jgi:hypothetical protein